LKLSSLKRFVPLCFGVLILVLVGATKVGWGEVFRIMSAADFAGVAAVFLMMTATIGVKSVREKLFLQKISKTAFSGLKPAQIFIVGVFSNEFLPTGSGELARAYIIKRLAKVGFGKPLAPLLIERSFDTFFLLLVALLGINFLFSSQEAAAFASLMLVVAMSAFFFASIFKKNFASSAAGFAGSVAQGLANALGVLKKAAHALRAKLEETGRSFEESRSLYVKDKTLLAQTFLLTVLGWAVEGYVQQTLLAALGFKVDYFAAFAIVALALLVGVFSFIPGGFGARDTAYAFFASLVGVPFEIGFSASVLYRAILYLWLAPTTAYSAWKLRSSVHEIEKAI
jgi:uncharacterized protein (TIRG00374 family)